MAEKISKWLSRKWWVTLATAVIWLLNELLNLGIDYNVIWGITGTAAAYCVGEGIADTSKK